MIHNTDSSFILITGACGGIGQALVKTFSQANYKVIATDIQQAGDELPCHMFIQADLQRTVQDEQYAKQIFDQIKTCLNGDGLKSLVNNAAVQILANFAHLSRNNWYSSLETNLLAPAIWTQAFLSELEVVQGCVLNISSIHARLTKPQFTAYATSKAALSGLTRSMAIELGHKIRVNAIEPAAIDTTMLRAGFEKCPQGLKQLKHYHPSQTIGESEKLAKLAQLVIEHDTLFLNGAIIPFDGGIGACLHDPQ